MSIRIVVERNGNAEVDVTEAVQIVYDVATGSMDFGSGFLDAGESRALYLLAKAAGWEEPKYGKDVCTCGHSRDAHRKQYTDGEYRCQTYDYSMSMQETLERGLSIYERERIYYCECRTFAWAEEEKSNG